MYVYMYHKGENGSDRVVFLRKASLFAAPSAEPVPIRKSNSWLTVFPIELAGTNIISY